MLAGVFMLAIYSYIALVTVGCGLNASFCFHRYTTPLEEQLAPYRYRVVSYVLESAFAESDDLQGLPLGALELHILLFLIAFGGLYVWLRRWLGFDRAVIGLLIVIGLLPMAYRIDMLNTSSIIEMALLCAFLLAFTYFPAALLIMALSAFNRETALLLIPVYAVLQRGEDSWIKHTAILALVYAGVTVGLHVGLGAAPHEYGLGGTWAHNQEQLIAAVFINLLFVPFVVMVARSYRKSPGAMKWMIGIAAAYVVASLIGGIWIETPRLFMPVYPLLLPVMLRET